jgi:hypothetical protein
LQAHVAERINQMGIKNMFVVPAAIGPHEGESFFVVELPLFCLADSLPVLFFIIIQQVLLPLI